MTSSPCSSRHLTVGTRLATSVIASTSTHEWPTPSGWNATHSLERLWVALWWKITCGSVCQWHLPSGCLSRTTRHPRWKTLRRKMHAFVSVWTNLSKRKRTICGRMMRHGCGSIAKTRSYQSMPHSHKGTFLRKLSMICARETLSIEKTTKSSVRNYLKGLLERARSRSNMSSMVSSNRSVTLITCVSTWTGMILWFWPRLTSTSSTMEKVLLCSKNRQSTWIVKQTMSGSKSSGTSTRP